MKKIHITIIIILIGVVSLIIIKNDKKIIKENSNNENFNFISMMLENENGNYEERIDINFPKENYIFNPDKSGCENGGTLVWNKEKQKIEASLITSDKCYAYFDKYDFTKSCMFGYEDNLACYLIKNKDNTLIYHDGKCDYEDEKNCELEAGDNNYRYAGADEDVNNYVCFGSDEENCPEDNLFRIIGIFDGSVKLIKADVANSDLLGQTGSYSQKAIPKEIYKGKKLFISVYFWQKPDIQYNYPNWLESSLNTVNLNNNYLNFFNEKWRKKIQNYSYQINGAKFDIYSTTNAKIIYDYELGKNAIEEKSNFAIGLMYLSDYMYAANSKYWNYSDYNESGEDYRLSVNDNWMHIGVHEWTITKNNYWTNNAFFKDDIGYLRTMYSHQNDAAIRPVFYLEKNIQAISGAGTESKPYYLTLNG